MKRYLRLWFAFQDRVDRRVYLLSGLILVALKYAGDVAIVKAGTGQLWDPFEYTRPIASLLGGPLKGAPPWVLTALVLWSIPFLWIGISMSMRRALDAGLSAWFALLFFVPGVKYLMLIGLCVAPSSEPSLEREAKPVPSDAKVPSALMAMAQGALLGVTLLGFSVTVLRSYGAALFLGTPFLVGAVTAWLFNRRYPATLEQTQVAVGATMIIVAGMAVMTAAEGAVCLFMAAPLGFGLAAIGAYIGRALARFNEEPAYNAFIGVLAVPLAASLDAGLPATELREVRTSIEVNASPEVVWRNVIAFPPLAKPNEWVFRAGISYPIRAEIRGEGIGAVRYCVFSTGAFVEPITQWEPGRRLSFDVTEQPRPMNEWSPYAEITPPHLDGYFESKRGEFRLIALPNGRTRLEGSTWYVMKLQPAMYWSLFGDAFIHRIHRRVLDHIRIEAERR